MPKTEKTYVCAVGMDSGKVRMEAGDPYTGNVKSLPWLIEQEHVVEDGSEAHAALVEQLAASDESEEG